MIADELSPQLQKVVDQVEKLMRMANRSPHPEEAATFQSKAMALLEAWNLDMETVEQNAEGTSGKRTDESLKGGHLQFQRDLWKAVAELNFCMYWSQVVEIKTRKWVPNATRTGFKPSYSIRRERQHRIVGKLVNARGTRVMAEYLEQALDRLMRERCEERNEQFRSKWATSFREGAAENIVERLRDRRAQLLREERERAAEKAREQAGHAAAREGISTGRDITLRGLIESEKEANLDFIHGEGWCARQAKFQAEQQQARAKAQAEYEAAYQRWRERNPEEAAEQDARRRKRLEEERKREERNRKRRDAYWANGGGSYREPKDKGDPAARYAGYDAAKNISIDLQADRQKPAGALG